MEIIFIATLMETALVAVLLILFFGARFLMQKNRKIKSPDQKIIADQKTVSKAIILSIKQEAFIANNARLKMLIQVMPDKERNFVIEITETLSASDLNSIHMGSPVSVEYTAANPKEITLIKVAERLIKHLPSSKQEKFQQG